MELINQILQTIIISFDITYCFVVNLLTYILMGIFLPIADVAFLVFGSLCLKKSENDCLVIKLPGTVDNDKLPKLK